MITQRIDYEKQAPQEGKFSLLCFIGMHSWTKWTEVMRQYHESTYKHLVHQERCCSDCGKLQGREVYY